MWRAAGNYVQIHIRVWHDSQARAFRAPGAIPLLGSLWAALGRQAGRQQAEGWQLLLEPEVGSRAILLMPVKVRCRWGPEQSRRSFV